MQASKQRSSTTKKQASPSGLHLSSLSRQWGKRMWNAAAFDNEEDNTISSEEFDEKGHLKIDLSDISNLTPRLKLLLEMERLALIAPGSLGDMRHRLMSYSPDDLYIPTGGIHKEEMKIPPLITILLVGFRGSGKSSLIKIM